jgi:predicted dehydrogenase
MAGYELALRSSNADQSISLCLVTALKTFSEPATWDTTMKTLKVGLIGCGQNSDNHLRVYSKNKKIRLVAVCDNILSKAKLKARKYGADRALSDYESLLRLGLDLIDITTPTTSHGQLSRMALETGHNVLVEKPMALNSRECEGMIKAARRNGKTLCVAHNKLFFKSLVRAKTVVDEGDLKVSRIRVSHHFAYSGFIDRWRLREESGGLLWDAVVHPVYLIEHFLGPTVSAYAVARKVQEDMPDSFTVVLQNKGIGLAEYVWNARHPLLDLHLMCEDGQSLHLDLVHDLVMERSRTHFDRRAYLLKLVVNDFRVPVTRWSGYFRNFLGMRSYPGALPFQRTFFVLIGQLVSFLNGEQDQPPVSAEEGLRAVRVLEALKKSIATGQTETVKN